MEGGGDRIGALPDAILHQILSDVDIQTAVQTSVPVKRWRRSEHYREVLVLRSSPQCSTSTAEHCPASLETLILDGIGTYNLKIAAPKLRRLEIFYISIGLHYESVIAISAPRQTSFKLKGNVSPVFSAVSLPRLADVHIDLGPIGVCAHEDRFPLNVMNMLGKLGEAKYVTLSNLSSKTLQGV
ncbi:hypothetical protein RHSIM_RhsimUnG0095900 [Rhododendron simsii]|uniref:F-box domain-containing protein n=1 Tax=Rhododendron simsii TaxID=118357 RepID=A0A834FVJ7_RHOSS|nr:hypothetical protein RHSIM_RhsimUnG0095900 [Rhododendron simsii]